MPNASSTPQMGSYPNNLLERSILKYLFCVAKLTLNLVNPASLPVNQLHPSASVARAKPRKGGILI